jgi:hypothetical protein
MSSSVGQRYKATMRVDMRYEPSDQIFIAEVEELGCWASGATEDEAIKALFEIVADRLVTLDGADPNSISIAPTAKRSEIEPAVHVGSREMSVLEPC